MPAEPARASSGSGEARPNVTSAVGAVTDYAVRSTDDDESAGGYFVTGTVKDLVPTW